MIHHFGDNQQLVFIRCRAHELEPLLTHTLEAVRRAARLEGATAEHARARLGDLSGDGIDLGGALHAARSGHNHHLLAADRDALAQLDEGAFRAKVAARELIGTRDTVDFLDAFQEFNPAMIEVRIGADGTQHGLRDTCRAMNIEAHFHQVVNDALDLLFRRALLHHHDHCSATPPTQDHSHNR